MNYELRTMNYRLFMLYFIWKQSIYKQNPRF